MKTWEVEVEYRVRRTLVLHGHDTQIVTAEKALPIVELLLSEAMDLSSFLKWTDGRRAHRPMPVETIIDNNPRIVAVREVPNG